MRLLRIHHRGPGDRVTLRDWLGYAKRLSVRVTLPVVSWLAGEAAAGRLSLGKIALCAVVIALALWLQSQGTRKEDRRRA